MRRARSPRGRLFGANRPSAGEGSYPRRLVIGRVLLVAILVVAGLRLIDVQGLQADKLAAQAERQRLTKVEIPAERGSITDRNGTKLAFSVESRALSVHPKRLRQDWTEAAVKHAAGGVDFDEHTQRIADYLGQKLGDAVDPAQLLQALRSDKTFVYLDENVRPAVADDIITRFPDIESEDRAAREYPSGDVASNIVGYANWRKNQVPPGTHGLLGLESSLDSLLAGKPGEELVDTQAGDNQVVIPGTERSVRAARSGSDVQLTIDTDVQDQVQRMLGDYAKRSGAKDGSAVVLDARTGEVYALANDVSFDPNDPNGLDHGHLGNPAITTPYEPGSVNKVVTAAAAIEYGIEKPDSSVGIPPTLQVADRTIHDAWSHGPMTMSATGVFAKSSNIGTLRIAQKVGPDRYAGMLRRMGIGQRTGIGLPGESPGFVPARKDWSGSTFGNLPIGQGLSMTVLQMASMYQAIANKGVRVPPRIIKAEIGPGGHRHSQPRPQGVRVVSEKTAHTVLDMFRSVTQDQPNLQTGTAPEAALPGYQISCKTGTGQKIDPATGTYSSSKYTIT
ncbi:MAG: peptidoglycan D,D-transpeptidase FtsI family protein, partial [Sciscionella sp.]